MMIGGHFLIEGAPMHRVKMIFSFMFLTTRTVKMFARETMRQNACTMLTNSEHQVAVILKENTGTLVIANVLLLLL